MVKLAPVAIGLSPAGSLNQVIVPAAVAVSVVVSPAQMVSLAATGLAAAGLTVTVTVVAGPWQPSALVCVTKKSVVVVRMPEV